MACSRTEMGWRPQMVFCVSRRYEVKREGSCDAMQSCFRKKTSKASQYSGQLRVETQRRLKHEERRKTKKKKRRKKKTQKFWK
jgi:hypothetical protein